MIERPSTTRFRSGRDLIARIQAPEPLLTVELRPPARKADEDGVERWIDMYHAVRRLNAEDTIVFLTDSAVGAPEEESIRHLAANLGGDADVSPVAPFLTTKHSLEYCQRFPDRALEAGHRAVVVLGGDRHLGPPRCVEHAVELRRILRQRSPGIALGGWANPYRDPVWQVDLLKQEEETTDFYLTQVVSHHDLDMLERFLVEADRQRLTIPGLFGVFYYRNGKPTTLEALRSFLPVPIEGLTRDFAEGLTPTEVCGRTLGALHALGVKGTYLCNLAPRNAAQQLQELRGYFK